VNVSLSVKLEELPPRFVERLEYFLAQELILFMVVISFEFVEEIGGIPFLIYYKSHS
jgi:hypothetical protein